jgi:hypothetical protein
MSRPTLRDSALSQPTRPLLAGASSVVLQERFVHLHTAKKRYLPVCTTTSAASSTFPLKAKSSLVIKEAFSSSPPRPQIATAASLFPGGHPQWVMTLRTVRATQTRCIKWPTKIVTSKLFMIIDDVTLPAEFVSAGKMSSPCLSLKRVLMGSGPSGGGYHGGSRRGGSVTVGLQHSYSGYNRPHQFVCCRAAKPDGPRRFGRPVCDSWFNSTFGPN